MEINFNRELLQTNYFKRWSGLNAKILFIQHSINAIECNLTKSWLRDYKTELETIKTDEKNLLKKSLQ